MSSFSTRRILRVGLAAVAVLSLALIGTIAVTALGGGGGSDAEPTPTERAQATADDPLAAPKTAEADDDATLPGDYVDLPAIYGAEYGGRPNTAAHVQDFVDYSDQGVPPAGGPHWGAARCGDQPSSSPPLCGPAPWGIYRQPWPAETLVHNMEHAGIIVWYDTDDQDVIDELEAFAAEQLENGTMLVMAPYPDMEDETVAITVWSRRETMDARDLDVDELARFIDVLYCRFDPEHFCRAAR